MGQSEIAACKGLIFLFFILKEDVGYLNKSFEAFPKHVPSLKFLFEHPCGTSGTGVIACVK